MKDRITLTALKVLDSLSHETLCFTCNVLLDGKKIGQAENRGNGGMTHILCDGDRTAFKAAMDFASAQPMLNSDGSQETSHTGSPAFYTLEGLVDEIAYKQHYRAKATTRLKRGLKTQTLILWNEQEWKIGRPFDAAVKAAVHQRHPGAVILNELTLEQAVDQVMALNERQMQAEKARWEKERGDGR